MSNSHILALDVGHKRIGVAIASHVARLPRPYGVVAGGPKAIQEIARLITAENVNALVVGLPRGLEGQETAQTGFVREFVAGLEQAVNVPITLQDEAVTSHKAEAELRERGVAFEKGDIDALAATIILNDFLEEQKVNNHEA